MRTSSSRSRLFATIAPWIMLLGACADLGLSGSDGGDFEDGSGEGTTGSTGSGLGDTTAQGGDQASGVGAGPIVYGPGAENFGGGGVGASDGQGGAGQGGAGDGGAGGGAPLDCASFDPGELIGALVTVDDSNSYASPMLVRELTSDVAWTVGDPLPVRAHEFLNAYGQKIQSEMLDEEIDDALHVGADASVDEHVDPQGRRLVRLAVSFTSTNAAAIAVPDVTFVMDTSSSMDDDAVARVQGVLRGAGRLIPTTRSVAAYTTNAGGTLVRGMGPWNGDVETLEVAATELDPETDFEATLGKALDTAREQAASAANPGVVLVVTDGTNPITPSGREQIREERGVWPPVRVVGVGVGPARTYVDDLLESVTDDSGGAYFYAPSPEEAENELAARYAALTQIVARNVELKLQVPASMQVVGVVGSEEPGDDPNGADGQNLGADSTMTFQIYLLAPAEAPCQTVGVALAWLDPNDPDVNTAARTFPADGSYRAVPLWHRFDPAFPPTPSYQRVATVLAVADALRGPTRSRVQGAADAMDAFLTELGSDDPLSVLCGPLARFCAADASVDCRICTP